MTLSPERGPGATDGRLDPGLRARVLEAAGREPAGTRPEEQRRTAMLLGSAAVVVVGLFFVLGGPEVGARPTPFVVGTSIGWALAAAAATWAGFLRGRSMLGPPYTWLLALLVAVPLTLSAWMLVMALAYPDVMANVPPGPATGCTVTTFILSAWPLVAFAIARGDSDPVHPRTTGAALGAAAGTWAGVMVDLYCPFASPMHVITRHIAPIAVLMLAGAALGHWMIAVRRRG